MKKIISGIVFVCFIAFSIATALAQPEVTVLHGAAGIPQNVLNDILMEVPEDSKVIIYGWHEGVEGEESKEIEPRAGWVFSDLKTTTTQTDVALNNYFVISVAKGATTTLSAEWKKTVKSSVSINSNAQGIPAPLAGKLEVSAEVTARYTVTRKFQGPPEESPYNSRQYRVRFYGDKGTWTGIAESQVNPANRPKVSGTWTKPTRYAEYSIDTKE